MVIHRDFVCGILVILLAAVYFLLTTGIQTSMLADDVGPDGLPRAYALVLGALGAALTLRSLPKWKAAPAPSAEDLDKRTKDRFQTRRALGMLLIGVFYIISAQVVGYAISIALVIMIAAIYQGTRATPRLAMTAILGALGLWVVFVWLLHIQQPVGIWFWMR